ncbi:hypothetical protein DIPPA_09747 [Diplonema papillatum]|nr:hypothetical protein DIPPA_09747 [Diplonema papillatum]
MAKRKRSSAHSRLLDDWQDSCIPEGFANVYAREADPVGLDSEIEKLTDHIRKVDGAFAFLMLKGPSGCGKSAAVRAALKRAYKLDCADQLNTIVRGEDSDDVDSSASGSTACPGGVEGTWDLEARRTCCGRKVHLCNVKTTVVELESPASSTAAFTQLQNCLKICSGEKIEGRHIDKPGMVEVFRQFGSVGRRVFVWIQGDFFAKHVESFLYFLTDLLHDRQAIAGLCILIETGLAYTMDMDARVVSRLSRQVLPIRPEAQCINFAKFIATRLVRHVPGMPQMQPVQGDPGIPQQHALPDGLLSPLFLSVVWAGKRVLHVTAVDTHLSQTKLRDTKTDGYRRNAPVRTTRLWAPQGHIITGYWMTYDEDEPRGVGLITTSSADDAGEGAEVSTRCWNCMVAMLASNRQIVERLHATGGIQAAADLLGTWLDRLSRPLFPNTPDTLRLLQPVVDSLPAEDAGWINAACAALGQKLAFHFYVTSRFRCCNIPRNLEARTLTVNVEDPVALSLFLEEVGEVHALESHYLVHQDFNCLSNSEMVLLCLLYRHRAHLEEAALKNGVTSAEVEMSAFKIEADYVRIVSKMTGAQQQHRYNWAMLMDMDLRHLVERQLVEALYSYMEDKLAPADIEPYKCKTKGWVLRHDSPGLLCVDYTKGDEYAGQCTDAQCCTPQICDSYTCQDKGYVLRQDAAAVDCAFECTDQICCTPTGKVPRHNPQGIMFVDRDPGRFSFGGTLRVLRALDEKDVTHYRIYWGFSKEIRKAPSCGVVNPVSWTVAKWYDPSKLFKEVRVTGYDIDIEIPLGTTPDARCDISYDRRDRTRAATDECNPHYWFAVSVNAHGEKDILSENTLQPGPRHPIRDYEEEFELPCAEGGITWGSDLPSADDVILGTPGSVATAAECKALCEAYTGSPPCRYWTWAYPTGGPTSRTCWIESQALQQKHYGVRVVGPRVCPTLADKEPAGYERTRCDRWVRMQNRAPWKDEETRWQFLKNSRLIIQKPQLPDVPLGPFDYAEACQAICDQDPMCLGFVWMKRDISDMYFHKCWMLHVDMPLYDYVTYDTWMCSRENMAPLLNGYELQTKHFGYKTCDTTPSATHFATTADCCASACDARVESCTAFTYRHHDHSCSLYKSCSKMRDHADVPGCAYASCFNSSNGAATYLKTAESYSIVDRWPDTFINQDGTLTLAIQATPGLEGAEVTCHVSRTGNPKRPVVAVDAAGMLAGLSYDRRATATIEGEHAVLRVKNEACGVAVTVGQSYMVTCSVFDAARYNVPQSVSLVVATRNPMNYDFTGNGYCKPPAADRCTQAVKVLGKVATFDLCKAACDERATCNAFWYRWTDGWCHLKIDGLCRYIQANTGSDVQCWRRVAATVAEGTDWFGPGNDTCDSPGGVTCAFKKKMGSYDRNAFTPLRNAATCGAPSILPTPAPSTPAPATRPPATPVPRTPSPPTKPPPSPPGSSHSMEVTLQLEDTSLSTLIATVNQVAAALQDELPVTSLTCRMICTTKKLGGNWVTVHCYSCDGASTAREAVLLDRDEERKNASFAFGGEGDERVELVFDVDTPDEPEMVEAIIRSNEQKTHPLYSVTGGLLTGALAVDRTIYTPIPPINVVEEDGSESGSSIDPFLLMVGIGVLLAAVCIGVSTCAWMYLRARLVDSANKAQEQEECNASNSENGVKRHRGKQLSLACSPECYPDHVPSDNIVDVSVNEPVSTTNQRPYLDNDIGSPASSFGFGSPTRVPLVRQTNGRHQRREFPTNGKHVVFDKPAPPEDGNDGERNDGDMESE